MKTSGMLTLSLFFVTLSILAAAAPDLPFPQSRKWAVVVGISSYEHPEIPSLRYAAEDARLFAAYLQQSSDFMTDPDRLLVFLNEQATVANIRGALGDFIAKQAQPDDTVIFFFAGHGGAELDFVTDENPEGAKFLLTYDTDPARYYGTGLNMRDDLDYVFHHRLQACRILCILDCCYSGAVTEGSRSVAGRGISVIKKLSMASVPPLTGLTLEGKDKQLMLLTACQAQEQALELASLGHGVLTHVIAKAFQGSGDANKDNMLSVAEFANYVKDESSRVSGDRQHPEIFNFQSDEPFITRFVTAKPSTETSTAKWSANATGNSKPLDPSAKVCLMNLETDYLAEIKEEAGTLVIGVVSSPEKASDVMEALRDARRKQREQIMKHLKLGPDAAEKVYRQGEVVFAQEFGSGVWRVVMKYPNQ